MAGKFKAIRKPIYAPNATTIGYGKYDVKDGDLILFRQDYGGGETRSYLGRVLGLATHDGVGKKYDKKVLLVLAANDTMTRGHERHVDIEDVLEIRRPGENELGVFAKWFLTGEMASPAETLRAVEFGAMGDNYLGRYLEDGRLVGFAKGDRPIQRNPTAPKTNPGSETGLVGKLKF